MKFCSSLCFLAIIIYKAKQRAEIIARISPVNFVPGSFRSADTIINMPTIANIKTGVDFRVGYSFRKIIDIMTANNGCMLSRKTELAIVVICREARGAQPVSGEYTPHTIRRITVHHTAVLLESNRSAPSRARQHQGYHQSLGWPDLAYHYLIDANGHIYEGRPVSAVGDTATDYDPTGHLLICCEGDFNQQEVPLAQYQSLLAVLAWGANQFGVAPDTIQGHRDLAATTCPGDHLYSFLEDRRLRDDVVATAVPELVVLCDENATELVAAIEAGTA